MDAKITLSFDETVIKKAKRYAENNNISLSRLTEFLLVKPVPVIINPWKIFQ
jgi:hypothetical protein